MDEVIETRFEAVESENVRQNKRLDKLESKVEQINDLVVSIKEISTNMTHMISTQETMQKDIEAIKSKSGDYWEKAVWIVVAALIGFAVSKAFGI